MMGEEDSDEEEKKEDENGVTWGFAEDAWEDDDKDDDLLPDTSKKANFLKVKNLISSHFITEKKTLVGLLVDNNIA